MRALQARVRALQRKLAKELAVVRLRRLSEEFCIESSAARPAANRRPTPMPLSSGWPPPGSGSHPSWRSTNTWRDAGSKTSSPSVKTSFAPSSPGPGAIPLPLSVRDERNCPSSRQVARWDPRGYPIVPRHPRRSGNPAPPPRPARCGRGGGAGRVVCHSPQSARRFLEQQAKYKKIHALCVLCGKKGLVKLDAGASLTTIRLEIRRRGAPLMINRPAVVFVLTRPGKRPLKTPGVQEYRPCPKTQTRPNTC